MKNKENKQNTMLEDEEDVCAITLEKLSSLKKVTKLKCGHQFCTHSLNLSLQISPLCPLCRTRILEIPLRREVPIYDIHDFSEDEYEESFASFENSYDEQSFDYSNSEDVAEYFDDDEDEI